ncbi:MAG: phosphodiesterase [Schwartzia sp.]|nr:phosphodiesterase [Schwartzia sp. (in: firmicutes)]
MKIGIISDTHGSEDCWKMAFDSFFHDADLILHAGDVLYHGPRNPLQADYGPARLAERLNACPVSIVAARGNCDSEVDASVLDMVLASPYAFVAEGGHRIVVTHGHFTEDDEEKDALAARLQADIFISGHTHIGGLVKRGQTVFVNPGSPSLSKRPDGRQTIALLDGATLSLHDLYTGEVLETMTLG